MSNNDQKREAMLALVEEWRQIGENRACFAAKHQISFAKFQYWVRISKAAATPKDFSELLLPISGEPIEMLEMSALDIQNGQLISQEAMDKGNLEWLNER